MKHNEQQITISAASADITSSNYTQILLPDNGLESPTGAVSGQANVLSVWAQSTANGAAGTLDVVFAYTTDGTTAIGTGVVACFRATVTPSTRRRARAGASGDYICDVVFTESLSHILDLIGYGNGTDGPKVYIGMSSLGGLTGVKLHTQWTRAI